jgi:hypothetical protein
MTFFKNERGSVVDDEYMVQKVFDDGDTVDADIDPTAPMDDPEVGSKHPNESANEDEDASAPKKRKKKDPNAPKRPANAFMLYSMNRRAETSDDKDRPKGPDFMKIIGQEWREMSDEAKAPYVQQSAGMQGAYREEKEKYDLAAPAASSSSSSGPVSDEQPRKLIRRLMKEVPPVLRPSVPSETTAPGSFASTPSLSVACSLLPGSQFSAPDPRGVGLISLCTLVEWTDVG